jgi:hypothetical protein
MTESQFFSRAGSPLTQEPWNVSLLPLAPVPSGGVARPAENLDHRRTGTLIEVAEWGRVPTEREREPISSSFESQREAIGW